MTAESLGQQQEEGQQPSLPAHNKRRRRRGTSGKLGTGKDRVPPTSDSPPSATEAPATTTQHLDTNRIRGEESSAAVSRKESFQKKENLQGKSRSKANDEETKEEESSMHRQELFKATQTRKRNSATSTRAKARSVDTVERTSHESSQSTASGNLDQTKQKSDRESKPNQKKKKRNNRKFAKPHSPNNESPHLEQQDVKNHIESLQEKMPLALTNENMTQTSKPKQKPQKKRNRNRERVSARDSNKSPDTANKSALEADEDSAEKPSPGDPPPYPEHSAANECLERYAANDPTLIRGKLRVLPARDAASFVTCDRGLHKLDICIPTSKERNRAMNGDIVYVELLPEDENQDDKKKQNDKSDGETKTIEKGMESLQIDQTPVNEFYEIASPSPVAITPKPGTWQDDPMQVDLWNPVVSIPRPRRRTTSECADNKPLQRKGKVVHIVPPKAVASELDPTQSELPLRRIVGSLKVMRKNLVLLTPNNKSLPQFLCPYYTSSLLERTEREHDNSEEVFDLERILFEAQYQYGSWKENNKWPPCIKLKPLGSTANIEDEILALLVENNVTTDDFSSEVLKDVDDAVKSGLYMEPGSNELGWKPTPDMYNGRRDYRSQRIFTIDPTTAKDLDDALHVTELRDGTIEIGVHIADVSFFIRPGSRVDKEAQQRATTVYLVDRTIPMLPRPLCEVACSLNENVERLAFSCVWRMNADGTICREKGKDCVWYGRTVIKSCARLDYATAQNIIDGKVSHGEPETEMDEDLWPKSRRPTGGHTVDEVAADVRLMHKVAMARRRLRFENGALALNGIKLTFQLDTDGQTPLLAAPYPIRDSNRLIEEYMLLANYLVAQRLITHTKGKALLRRHEEPLEEGLDQVAAIAKAAMDFDIDISDSQTLHKSLVRLGNECKDPLVLQCVTQMLMTPMRPAVYFAAGTMESELWRHFALNIPYYTHFTSPIRRYPDVIVHRLLQASLDSEQAVKKFYIDETEIDKQAAHCSEKGLASKAAQERCDRIFLALHVRSHPISSQLGVVLSVGVSTFTVFVPSLGVAAMLFLDEHKEVLTFASEQQENGKRRILLQQKSDAPHPRWETLEIEIFTKLTVSLTFRDKPPIDVKVRLEDRWRS